MNVISTTASAGITGFESPASEYTQLSCSLDELLIEHPSATYLGQASGNSMEQVGIYDGDLLIIDRHVKEKQNDIIVAVLNGEFVCKIIDIERRMLLSASDSHRPIRIDELDSFSCEGVVIRSIRCHRPSHLLRH